MAELIRKQDGLPLVAPSMREVPLDQNTAALAFARRLLAGEFEMMILLTGVGTRQLNRVLAAQFHETALADALRRLTVVARGPKPAAVLREIHVTPALIAPEPNTWREVLAVTEGRPERSIAIQEYGRPNPELVAGLEARGADVVSVRIYQWDLPEDTGPLRQAVHQLAGGGFDVVLFTTAIQISHLLRVAEQEGVAAAALDGLRRALVASIGPTTTEALEEFGIHPALEPSHPKMGFLVREAAGRADS